MNRNYVKMNAMIISLLVALIMNTGFVTWAVANPVSLYAEKESEIYKVSVVLEEASQINAFQLKIEYNRQYLQLQRVYFDEQFELSYNGQNNGLLKCSNNGETNGYVRFLGVQTDDSAASQKSGTVIGIMEFTTDLTDVAELAKALDTVVMTVEVIQSDDGNLAPKDGSWRVKASINNKKYEKKPGDEEDLKEDVGSYGENAGITSKTDNMEAGSGLDKAESTPKVTNEGVSEDATENMPEVTSKTAIQATTKAASAVITKEGKNDISTGDGVASDVATDSQNNQHEIEKNTSENKNSEHISQVKESKKSKNNRISAIRFLIRTAVILVIIMLVRKYKEKKKM